MEAFKATLSPMLVMLLCIVIGFILNKLNLLPENSATVLSKLVNFILVPSLIITTFMKYCTVASLKEQYKLILYSLSAVLISIGIAYLLAPLFEKDAYKKNIYRYAITFSNFSFLGNAIVPAILGEEMLFDYLIFSLPLNFAVYTWGIAILIPLKGKKNNPLYSLFNPIIFSLGIGIIFGLANVQKIIPIFITSSLNSFAACMGPIAMLLTGFTIGGYNVLTLLKNKKVYVITFLRLFILPALLLTLLYFSGADSHILTLALFAFASPLGLNTIIFPAAYGGDTKIGASMALISHSFGIVSIPILYSILKAIL